MEGGLDAWRVLLLDGVLPCISEGRAGSFRRAAEQVLGMAPTGAAGPSLALEDDLLLGPAADDKAGVG